MDQNLEKKVSVIVTTRNNEKTIEECLKSVTHQTYKNIELIVVDNNSSDKTQKISFGYTDNVFNIGPERSAQRNFGAKMSKGDFLLFIDSDMILSPQVIEESCDKFVVNPSISVLFIPEETRAEGFWGKCKKFERDFYLDGDLSVEAVRFFRRNEFIDLGGFDVNQTGTEDWDLSDRALASYEHSRIRSRIIHNEGYIDLWEQVRKKRYYSKKGVAKYLMTAPSYRKTFYPLKHSVIKQSYRFIKNPLLGFGSILLKMFEFISMLT